MRVPADHHGSSLFGALAAILRQEDRYIEDVGCLYDFVCTCTKDFCGDLCCLHYGFPVSWLFVMGFLFAIKAISAS